MTQENNPFKANWTAKGNNLCLGHWEISYLGSSIKLQPEYRQSDMGTYGIFSYIYPDDETFAEGLSEDAWITSKCAWLLDLFTQNNIPSDEIHFRWFYQAVNSQDWRCGSCGGCI